MRTRVFTVTPETWKEHRAAGIAGINDPLQKSEAKQVYAIRQTALTEVASIRPQDRIFFYVQRTKEVLGVYEATTKPFFDQEPIFEGAKFVNEKFPFRVGFKPTIEYPRPLHVNEIWAGRDAGQIWTMQQARGDAIGRHSCWALTKLEGDILEKMLQELNITAEEQIEVPEPPLLRNVLPFDLKIQGKKYPHLHYEAALQSSILNGLADLKWRDIFGEYEDFLPYVSTSEGKEIDVLLLKYLNSEILWYQLLELKSDRFRFEDLLQLLSYEIWLTSNQAGGNPRSVHMAAVASRFDDDVLNQVSIRKDLKQKPVRLLKYSYDSEENELHIEDISP